MSPENIALLRMMHLELVKAAADRNTFEFAPEYVPLLAVAVAQAIDQATSETVLELNKRITALHQRLERIRICVIEWEHGNQASAVMPRIRHELDQENP